MKQVSQEHLDTTVLVLARFLCEHREGVPCIHCLKGAAEGMFDIMTQGEVTLMQGDPALGTFEDFLRSTLARSGVDLDVLEKAIKDNVPRPSRRGGRRGTTHSK